MSVRRMLRETIRMANLTSASNVALINGTTDGLAIGDAVRGYGVPLGTTITAVAAGSVTLSANATVSTSTQLSFTGQLANVGSTGNNTHASVGADGFTDADVLSLEFEITAVGGTPTISWLFQGSMDGPDVTDAASDWFALEVLPSDSAVESAAVQTKTAVGVYESSVEIARRPIRKVRLVTSANTNVTYEADIYAVDQD